jgi:hypothetical protein
MLSFLKKIFSNSEPTFQEKVWMSKPYKFQGLYEDLSEITKTGHKAFIFTHFEKTYQEVCFVLEQKEIPFYQFQKGDDTSILAFNQVAIFQANALEKRVIENLQSQQIPVRCLILEHFPLRTNDEELLAKLKTIAPQATPVFYTSLEDAALQPFVTENLKQIMVKMGMKADESVSHKMISKSIINAQEKIAQQVKSNRMTYAPEEWIKVNL